MNRLRGAGCYLAGPMSYLPDLGVGWRQDIIPDLEAMGVVVFDPCDKQIGIGKESQEERRHLHEHQAAGDFEAVARFMKVIRRVDLRCVDLASFIIVRLDGSPTMGTYEEIAMAVKEQKPTLVWLDGTLNKRNVNPWLYAQIDPKYVFESWWEVLNYLKQIDQGQEHPTDRRVMLFDFVKLYSKAITDANS
ncbi:MAG: nucleoside 2-deoxyribosyltransferase [Nitrososphaera sp.]|nr:nucleoside 2-deoxyribosyltransferase [Nitrososphaera sp.]